MRAEIRNTLSMISASFQTGVVMIAAVVSFSGFLKNVKFLYVIPSLMFLSTMVMLFQGATCNTIGTYCEVIAKKLRARLGEDDVVFLWESGKIWHEAGHPLGIVHVGIYLTALPGILIFCGITWLAFKWWPPSLAVHIAEFVCCVAYAVLVFQCNSKAYRSKMTERVKP